jgi:uncharacterized RDD family membrane protein YckC
MDTNPYQPPEADLTTQNSTGELASPWIRLGAAIIDGIVLWPINFVLQKIFITAPSPEKMMEIMKTVNNDPFAAAKAVMPGTGTMLLIGILGLAAMIGVNFNFMKKGQTVGKMALKLQIQRRSDGSILPIQELITKRILPVYGASFIGNAIHPIVGMAVGLFLLVDALCIFRRDRNTIHDDIAGTKVVVLR